MYFFDWLLLFKKHLQVRRTLQTNLNGRKKIFHKKKRYPEHLGIALEKIT